MKTHQQADRQMASRREFLRLCGLGLVGLLGAARCARRTAEERLSQLPAGPTPTASSTATLTPGPTSTSIPTPNPTATLTPEPTPTQIPTSTPTDTATPEPTSTETSTPTSTSTATPAPVAEDTLAPVIVAYNPQVSDYPSMSPFDPSQVYPEYPFSQDQPGSVNGAYDLVRQALQALHPEGYGEPDWNPLAGIVQPGDTVLIKPNLVDDALWDQGKITHPAVIRAVIDYAYLACGPTGRIILGEGPWAVGVFDRLVVNTGIQQMVQHLAQEHGIPVVLEDLNKAAPESTPLIALGEISAFHGVNRRWNDAHRTELRPGGDPGIGSYRIAPTVLQADVVISVPKIKVHCSGGLTLNMKNMLGIIPSWDGYADGNLKDCAHTSDVDLAMGARGEYLENDTIWRSMADLNRILLYADRTGVLHPERQRRYLAIVDGIAAGEASQYEPHPRPLGTVVIGFDPVTVDAVTARVSGFDQRRLRSVVNPASQGAYGLGPANPAEIRLTVSGASTLQEFCTQERVIIPETGVYSWQGQVEAHDFQPPRLSWHYDGEHQQLIVQADDPAGVAYVRLAYRRLGEPRFKALELQQGNTISGEWIVPLPAPEQVEGLRLSAMDELFNASELPIHM
jgi:uncharacterized protein (DUF362 family)